MESRVAEPGWQIIWETRFFYFLISVIPYGSSCRADDELPVFHQLSQTTKQNLAVQTDKFAHMIVYSVHQEQIVFVINDFECSRS